MENFKEIAEKCLAGKLSGVFISNTGVKFHSYYLIKSGSENYFYLSGLFIYKDGQIITKGVGAQEIINFIPDNMKEQIKIDIPEGKVPVMEQTENEVVITWKDKELTYSEIYIDLFHKDQHISAPRYCNVNDNSRQFNKKVEVLRKLTNIRNYFGLDPQRNNNWVIHPSIDGTYYAKATRQSLYYEVAFSKQEHAEQAIKMLGNELKYLFEPW